MNNYSFTPFTDANKESIDGWVDFANRCVEAVNAFNAADGIPSIFECGGGVGDMPRPVVEGLLDSMIGDLYESMVALPDPFAHLAAVLGQLAALTFMDAEGAPILKALCYQNLLMVQDRVVTLHCQTTGFTARKVKEGTEDE